MDRNPDVRRRWFGAMFLLAALLMLVAGQTFLRERLGAVTFLFYWFVCLIFTLLAMLVALLDVAAVRRRTRNQQRELLESTLEQIVREKEIRSRKPGKPGNRPR